MATSSQPLKLTQDGFNAYNAELQTAALKATRNAAFLPADLGFYRSLDRGIAKDVDACSTRVLSLANKLLGLVATADTSRSKSKGKARLEHDDVTDNFRSSVVDAMDQLLERADICLDEFLGLSKAPAIAVNMQAEKQKPAKAIKTAPGRLDPVIQHASHLPKPQLQFKRKVDNADIVWKPSLRHKYNAKVPLGYDIRDENDDADSLLSLHPYRHEIRHIDYPANMFASVEPVSPKSFDDTPFSWVATSEEFTIMLEKLRGAKEIAIDLEYHSYRSFYGFVCLMQISTRSEDWVVDTLQLRDELEELNEVFTDPNIVKVLHGAESDIVWLQQDFNLYIVNLFDTYHASKVLAFPRHSLATLMEMYCDFTPDKRYQLADWRIRPLPEEMLRYARSDTHFLLFIYDHLRNALLDRAQSRSQSPAVAASAEEEAGTNPAHALVREVLRRSAETALRVLEREPYDAGGGTGASGWDTLARKWNKGALMAGGRETARLRVYRAVHAWRDRVAREEDESTRYVLPNHNLFLFAEQPPADIAGLLSMFQYVPPVVRKRVKELFEVIHGAAKEVTEEAPVVEAVVAAEAPMLVDEEEKVDEAKVPQSAAGLWPNGTAAKLAALSSTLLGNVPRTDKNMFAASRSALFAQPRVASVAEAHKQRFGNVVAKIHNSLTIAPVAPKVTSSVATTSAVTLEEAEEVAGQVEMAFVPAGQRQEKGPVVEDSLVVVGQVSRQRKRKRVKADKTKTKTEGAEEEVFDYAAVPNILDDGSDHEPEEGGRKRRQKGQGRFDYGNFRAPPKAQNEPKSGNQSRTFK